MENENLKKMMKDLEQIRLDDALESLALEMKPQLHHRQPCKILTASIKTRAPFGKYFSKLTFGRIIQPTKDFRPKSSVFVCIFETKKDIQKLWPDLLHKNFNGGAYAELVAPLVLKYNSNTNRLSAKFKYSAHCEDGRLFYCIY